jgi:hypothetical protein
VGVVTTLALSISADQARDRNERRLLEQQALGGIAISTGAVTFQ